MRVIHHGKAGSIGEEQSGRHPHEMESPSTQHPPASQSGAISREEEKHTLRHDCKKSHYFPLLSHLSNRFQNECFTLMAKLYALRKTHNNGKLMEGAQSRPCSYPHRGYKEILESDFPSFLFLIPSRIDLNRLCF